MTGIKKIRLKFGLTQDQLSFYLGVSLGLLKMAEIGRRSLPTEAMLKLGKLTLIELPEPAAITPTDEPNRKIEKERREYRLVKEKLKIKLESLQAAYNDATNQLALAEHLLEEQPTNEDELLWLNLLKRKATAAMKKYGLEEQAYLSWKINWLEYRGGGVQEV